jgi:integrase
MARGSVFQPSYTVKRPDGTRELRKSRTYWIKYRDGQGVLRREPVGESKRQAEDALAKKISGAIDERFGLPTHGAAMMPAGELVKAYLEAQRSRVSAMHLTNISARIDAVVLGTRAVTVKDLSADRVEEFLREYAKGDPENKVPPPAPSTVNGYLQAIKTLFAWAVERRKLQYNPLSSLKRRSVAFKARDRRPLTELEAGQLLFSALDGPARRMQKAYKGAGLPSDVLEKCKVQGRRNSLAYRLMLTTGLRLNEVQTLRWHDIDLTNGYLRLRGDKGDKLKGRIEEKELPLPAETVAALKAWRAETKAVDSAKVVEVPITLVRYLADDLEAAGISNPDSAGRVVDCHSLRHTFGTWLGKRPDVDAKTIQKMMRHKNAAFTLQTYVHGDKTQMRVAADKMPALVPIPFAGTRSGQEQQGQSLQDTASANDSMAASISSQPEDRGSNPRGDTNAPRTKYEADFRIEHGILGRGNFDSF